MKESPYLIVGGGLTGDAACRGIRELDAEGEIVLVGAEPHPPYARPPLSKALWKGKSEDTVWRGTEALGVDVRLGRRIVALDLERREARDDQGESYRYEKLLLAPGVRPRRLPFGGDDVIYFRTLDDYRRLRALADRKCARRRDRRRLHRLRDRRRARAQRLRGDDGLPGAGHRRPHLPASAVGRTQRLLPRSRRRGLGRPPPSRRSSAGVSH